MLLKLKDVGDVGFGFVERRYTTVAGNRSRPSIICCDGKRGVAVEAVKQVFQIVRATVQVLLRIKGVLDPILRSRTVH